MTTPKHFTIPRDVWLRGDQKSYLLRPEDGKRCCVGIMLQQCGAPDNSMRGVAVVDDLNRETLDGATWLPPFLVRLVDDEDEDGGEFEVVRESALAEDLYCINDNPNTSDEDKERSIALRLEPLGVTVEFVDTLGAQS